MNRLKACDHCSRSKTKCTWSDEEACHRCSKLKLSCTSTPPGPRKKREQSSRVKTLEQKVDGLMTLLATSQQPSPSPSAQEQSTPPMLPWMHENIRIPSSPSTFAGHHTKHGSDIRDQYIEFVAGFRVSFDEADRILHEYRVNMLPSFPFVPISHLNARDMYQKQPILLKTIISSCRPQPVVVQNSIDQWYREYFAYHIVVLNESRLEFLQAIIIFVAWQDPNFFARTQDTSILQLALGLVGDLGLNRPPEAQKLPPGSIMDDGVVRVMGINLQTSRSLADRRALLGIFYITAAARTLFRRSPPMEYTSYMEQCCEALLKADEYPTDPLIVGAVRMQQLVLKVNTFFPEKNINESRRSITGSDAVAIVTTHRSLEETIAQFPDNLKSSYLLQSHYHAVRVRLYEPAIYMLPSTIANHLLTRGQALWDCLQGIKSVFEQLLEIPAEKLSTLCCPFFAHLSFANVTLSRLLLAKDTDWDAALAFKGAGILRLLELLGDHLELGDQLSGPRRQIMDDGLSFLIKLAGKMRWAKNWYHARLPNDSLSTNSMASVSPSIYDTGEEGQFWQGLFDMDQPLVF